MICAHAARRMQKDGDNQLPLLLVKYVFAQNEPVAERRAQIHADEGRLLEITPMHYENFIDKFRGID